MNIKKYESQFLFGIMVYNNLNWTIDYLKAETIKLLENNIRRLSS